MANYYTAGYSTPAGVDNRADVRDYQRLLGVRADGIWGPVTQAAYDRSAQANPAYSALDAFKSNYDALLGALSVPGIELNIPTRAELAADYGEMLRPGVDLAIKKRRTRGETAMAEIDADAAARGMAASTYVSSMKEREDDDWQEDVSMLEAQYTATLAERIAAALASYASLEMQASGVNAQMAASARNTAAGIAAQWLNNANAAKPAFTSERASEPENGLTREEGLEYVSLLSQSERESLFHSASDDWAKRRAELMGALGSKAYDELVKAYERTLSKSGGSAWAMTLR